MTSAEFEAGVKRWHESDSTLDIWEFLGISSEQYARMVTGQQESTVPLAAREIAKSREEQMVAYTITKTTEHLRKLDIVEVVRCADCKHGEPDEMGDCALVHCGIDGHLVSLDHFCAKGERKA
jgi:hypothetical protein